jgi:REP element-mobilizing transposase RayT
MSTHQQLLYHIVFSTKNRQPWLTDGFRENVFAYIAGVIQHLGGFPLRIGGYYEHVHLLTRIPAKLALSECVGKIKANTSKHINSTSHLPRKFGWQDGYGALTVSISQKDRLIAYVDQQMEHHRARSFEDEYVALLRRHEVEYDPRYLWD